jgi:hypothetical protein
MIDAAAKERLLRHKKWANLENTVVRRKGLTGRQRYYFETDKGVTLKGSSGADGTGLAISFLLPGGRKPEDTIVEIAVKPGDFPAVVALMAATDREAAWRTPARPADQLRAATRLQFAVDNRAVVCAEESTVSIHDWAGAIVGECRSG